MDWALQNLKWSGAGGAPDAGNMNDGGSGKMRTSHTNEAERSAKRTGTASGNGEVKRLTVKGTE